MEVLPSGREQVQTLDMAPYVVSLRIEIEFLLVLCSSKQPKEAGHSRTWWQSKYCYYHHSQL